jgi:hypothetical protein
VGGLRIVPTAFFILRITAAICGGRGAGVLAPVWGWRFVAVMPRGKVGIVACPLPPWAVDRQGAGGVKRTAAAQKGRRAIPGKIAEWSGAQRSNFDLFISAALQGIKALLPLEFRAMDGRGGHRLTLEVRKAGWNSRGGEGYWRIEFLFIRAKL